MTCVLTTTDTPLTPALRRVLQVLARSSRPHTYASVGQEIDRTPKAVEKTTRFLLTALAGTGITITRRRQSGGSAMQLSVSGDPAVIGRLLSEAPAAIPAASAAQHTDIITLPSIGGVAYAYAAEGRLIVGGVMQPARIA